MGHELVAGERLNSGDMVYFDAVGTVRRWPDRVLTVEEMLNREGFVEVPASPSERPNIVRQFRKEPWKLTQSEQA